jgi:hypothetical protein
MSELTSVPVRELTDDERQQIAAFQDILRTLLPAFDEKGRPKSLLDYKKSARKRRDLPIIHSLKNC